MTFGTRLTLFCGLFAVMIITAVAPAEARQGRGRDGHDSFSDHRDDSHRRRRGRGDGYSRDDMGELRSSSSHSSRSGRRNRDRSNASDYLDRF